MQTALPVLPAELRRRIEAAGWRIGKVHRIYPPDDGGGQIEVLFLGNRRGAGSQPRALTALVADAKDSVPSVRPGW